jgi:hypothetical protein
MESEIVIQKLDELTSKVNTLPEAHNHNTRPQNEWFDTEETVRILKWSEGTQQTIRDYPLRE